MRSSRVVVAIVSIVSLAAAGCRGRGLGSSAAGGVSERGDAVFVSGGAAIVPQELDVELEAMGVKRLFVEGATLTRAGQVRPAPPAPHKIGRSTVLVVQAEEGVQGMLASAQPEELGAKWATGIAKAVVEARAWANVTGVHVHLLPAPSDAEILAKVLRVVRDELDGLSLSVSVPTGSDPKVWAPLAGSVDEVLVLSFGRAPDTGDRFVAEMTEEEAKAFPLPFRLLVVVGGYGIAEPGTRRIPDGEVDRLSEDRSLDFDFGQVLSSEPGTVYNFKPRIGSESFAAASGVVRARFNVLSFQEAVRFVAGTSRWAASNLRGRVFLVDGLPRDAHLAGFSALQALLTGKPFEPSLRMEVRPSRVQKGVAEIFLTVANTGPTATELSRFGNWVTLRVTGGVLAAVSAGDFDRFELFVPVGDELQPAPFGKTTVCKLFENLFAAGESNEAGPIRILGFSPQLYVSYELLLPDGKVIKGPETAIPLTPPTPAPAQSPAK